MYVLLHHNDLWAHLGSSWFITIITLEKYSSFKDADESAAIIKALMRSSRSYLDATGNNPAVNNCTEHRG